MRNPLNSWARNDSACKCDPNTGHAVEVKLGPNDYDLCRRLITAGSEHRKMLRQIHVTMDITAPFYWWAEFDTYKQSVTRNSCSFQHKGASRPYEDKDFGMDDLEYVNIPTELKERLIAARAQLTEVLNDVRDSYVETKDYGAFRLIRQNVPSGYLYKATCSMNYEVLLNMFRQRKNHKLIEWHQFIDILLEQIPYFKEFTEFAESKVNKNA